MKNYILIIVVTLMFFGCDKTVVFEEDRTKVDNLRDAFGELNEGNYIEAEEIFQDAINLGTIARTDTLYAGLGIAQMRLYKFTEALVSLDSALVHNPTMIEALYPQMVINYAFLQMFNTTVEIGNKIVEINSDWVFKYDITSNIKDVYLHLALAEFELKNYQSSYEFTKNISTQILDPLDSNFIVNLAELHAQLSIELKGN